jgi:hypothetical protein
MSRGPHWSADISFARENPKIMKSEIGKIIDTVGRVADHRGPSFPAFGHTTRCPALAPVPLARAPRCFGSAIGRGLGSFSGAGASGVSAARAIAAYIDFPEGLLLFPSAETTIFLSTSRPYRPILESSPCIHRNAMARRPEDAKRAAPESDGDKMPTSGIVNNIRADLRQICRHLA